MNWPAAGGKCLCHLFGENLAVLCSFKIHIFYDFERFCEWVQVLVVFIVTGASELRAY